MNLAQDGLQVELGVVVGFGASKMGAQTLVEVVQANAPAAHGPKSCLDRLGCGMVGMLHAFLAFDGLPHKEVVAR